MYNRYRVLPFRSGMERGGPLWESEGKELMGYSKRWVDSERGANLVEFAVLAPLLIILLLGIVEFGWLFGQVNDVRHGAREGARIAAVNGVADQNELHTRTCDSMDLAGTSASVLFTDSTNGLRGEEAVVKVVADPESLSNLSLITVFLPDSIESEVRFILEQDSDNWNTTPNTATLPLEGFTCP